MFETCFLLIVLCNLTLTKKYSINMTQINFCVDGPLCSKVSVPTSTKPIRLVFRTEVMTDQKLPKTLAKKNIKLCLALEVKLLFEAYKDIKLNQP